MTQNSQEFISMNQNQFYCVKIHPKIFIFLPQRIHHLQINIQSIQKRIFKSKLSGKDKESPLKLTPVSPKNLKTDIDQNLFILCCTNQQNLFPDDECKFKFSLAPQF